MKTKTGFEMLNVCGEFIIVPAGNENRDYSRVIGLNETAAELWKKTSEMESFTIDDMVNRIMEEYEVEEEIAREDCALIAERWREVGLIEE